MKITALRVIVAIAAITALGLALGLWQRPSAPPVTIAAAPPGQSSDQPRPATPSAPPPADSRQIQDLQGRLATESSARQRAEAEAAALRQQLAPLQSNVVVSLGTVQNMGKRAGALLPAWGELQALTSRDPATLSPDEKRRLLELQRDHAQLLGALPEITHFQDNPGDYGRFFSSMLQQAAGLTDPEAAQVETYMRERATVMNQNELNSAKEPTDPTLKAAWEERRDQFNEQTAAGLNAVLPPGAVGKAGVGPGLMEFLEMDFDKLNPGLLEKQAP